MIQTRPTGEIDKNFKETTSDHASNKTYVSAVVEQYDQKQLNALEKEKMLNASFGRDGKTKTFEKNF